MNITVVRKKDLYTFVVDGITPAFANTLRRTMMTEVPTQAVDYLEIHKNTSVLFDEMIAQRLGMIPLVFDASTCSFRETCSCGGEGCSLCQTVFALEKTGPCTVYSGDLKSSHPAVKPTSPHFPIVELLEGQELKLEAYTKYGKGKEHSKFQAANVGYSYYPELKVEGTVESTKKILDAFPQGILKAEGKSLKLIDPYNPNVLDPRYDDGKVKVKVEGNPNKIIFRVESVSGLDAKDIVEQAAQIIEAKAEEFKKDVKKL